MGRVEQKMSQLNNPQSIVIPETPQQEESSTSKRVINIEKDSQPSNQESNMSDSNSFQINNQNWKTPLKLYYPRTSLPDNLLEEKLNQNFKSFSVDHIYEWNIDGQSETNILQILQ